MRKIIFIAFTCVCAGFLIQAEADCKDVNKNESYPNTSVHQDGLVVVAKSNSHSCSDLKKFPLDQFLDQSVRRAGKIIYPGFDKNPLMSKKMRSLMAAYLLPLNHPIKRTLDSIFRHRRVVDNEKTLRKAGFSILCAQKKSYIVVARHHKVPGYLFKMYLDSRKSMKDGTPGWKWLLTRCVVAEKIKKIIEDRHYQMYSVADKWLYPLTVRAKKCYLHPQNVVLVVKDMNIFNRRKSEVAWRNQITKQHLDELYGIFSEGYGSAFLPANLPYTRSGKFAFIDTEYSKRKIPMSNVLKYVSKEMGEYWTSLIKENKRKRK